MRHSRMLVIALCGALSLGGCGGGDDDGGGNRNSPEDRADAPAATTEPEETAMATPTAAVEEGAEDALAEQTGLKARSARTTTVDIAVLSLEVAGKLATLTLSFTAHDPEAAPDTSYSLADLNGSSPTLSVTLLDPVNLRRYMVVKDSDDDALESRDDFVDVPLDASATAKYTFAAPPPDVTKIDVSVGDWPTFRDVPIER